LRESAQEQAQENFEPRQQAPEVIAAGSEHGVDGVTVAIGEEVPIHAVIVLAMANDRLDAGAAFKLASYNQPP
jgi:hypothetical protein